jgi:glycosyltransferase involved in cell wall biosynthesis
MVAVGLGVGGTEGQISEIAARLDPRRFTVCVCALKGEDVLARELRARGVRVVTLGGQARFDIRVIWRLARLIREVRPDVIHAFLFWANVASRVLGKLLGVPILISSYRDREIWHGRLHLMIDCLTARWADAVTCCSEAVRQFVTSRLGGEEKKFVTIPNGIDVDRFEVRTTRTKSDLGLCADLPVIGTVCRLVEPKKGLSVLLHALGRLAQQSATPRCQLLIVGDGPALDHLRRLSDQLGIAPWVVFAGMRRDVPSLLPLMDVFVLPSAYEGFGISIIEAMAAGRPVVATAVGGIPDIVVHGETGLLVPPADPAALASAVDTLLTNPRKAATFGARGRERASERFSIEAVVRRHAELYESLLVGVE